MSASIDALVPGGYGSSIGAPAPQTYTPAPGGILEGLWDVTRYGLTRAIDVNAERIGAQTQNQIQQQNTAAVLAARQAQQPAIPQWVILAGVGLVAFALLRK